VKTLLVWLSVLALQGAQPLPLGKITFPNSGAPAAQAPFVRGVLLLHSFEYDDAIAAFREAQKADPGFALAYWGEAMCFNQTLWYNENLAKGREALARYRGQTPGAPTARENGYLDAVEKMFGPGDKASRNRAYADRMGELSRQFPEDEEAAAFYALALLGTQPESGSRDSAVTLKAGGIALAILKKNPQHPGAAHYALHAFDDGEHAAMGLEAARTYAKIAPASSHARHMPSHVFLPLGMWDEAAASDEAAFATSVDLAKRKGLSASQYDFHSLSWLQYEYLQQGRFAKAREAMNTVQEIQKVQEGSRGSTNVHLNHAESEIGRGYGPMSLKAELASMRARYVLESGRWDEMKGRTSFDNVDELFALGFASVRLGDLARARAAYDHLKNARDQAPDEDNRQLAQIMMAAVAGLIQIAQGDQARGLTALADGARIEGGRPRPIARPYPVKPATEIYAEALLASGDAAGAVRQFEASLARTPRRAASLLGLARAQQAAGQRAAATRTAREFLAVWHASDSGRPEVKEARTLGSQ